MRRTVRNGLYAVVTVAVAAGGAVGPGGMAGAAGAAAGHTARAAHAPRAGHAQARTATPAYVPSGGVLKPGMSGPAVRKLQQRLAQLHYYPGRVNGHFWHATTEAVWAFKEVQGISTAHRPDRAGSVVQHALVSPRKPRVLAPHGPKLRIEINLRRQVLVLYRHGKVSLVSHISPGGGYFYPCPGGGTCGPAITPDGNYRAHWFARGWLTVPLGQMYNPVFFIGGEFAIHGDIPVPLKAASHGCVRIPMDIAQWFHKQIRISQAHGTRIYIRGHVPGTKHESALRQRGALP
jgi:lipoprotein-anchoring transpeptidase ErfK/SrfK